MFSEPLAVAFDGTDIWVTGSFGNIVTKLLASTGAVIANYPVGFYADGVAFDGSNVWVANQSSNNITKIPAF